MINVADNATEHREDNTAESSSTPYAVTRNIDAELAEERAKIVKLLAVRGEPPLTRDVEAARVVRSSPDTLSASDTIQRAPQRCTADQMMPAVELESNGPEPTTGPHQLVGELTELTSVQGWNSDPDLTNQFISMVPTRSRSR